MRKVHTAESAIEIAHLRNLLESEGIACLVRNDRLAGVIGEIPFVECWPELWVRRIRPGTASARTRSTWRSDRGRTRRRLDLPSAAASGSKRSSPSAGTASGPPNPGRGTREDRDHRTPLQRAARLRQRRLCLRCLRRRRRASTCGCGCWHRRRSTKRWPCRCSRAGTWELRHRGRAGSRSARPPGSISTCRRRRRTCRRSGRRSTTRGSAIIRFPDCFVCGPHRRRGDGLRIFPGHARDRHRRGAVAAGRRPRRRRRQGRGRVPLGGARLPGLFRRLRRAAGP